MVVDLLMCFGAPASLHFRIAAADYQIRLKNHPCTLTTSLRLTHFFIPLNYDWFLAREFHNGNRNFITNVAGV